MILLKYKKEKRKMKKVLSIVITMILVSSIFFVAVPTQAVGPTIADVEPVDWKSGLAGEVPMPTLSAEDYAEAAAAASVMTAESTPPIGTTVWDWYLRALGRAIYDPTSNYAYMTLRAISGNAEVWVAADQLLMYYHNATYSDPRNADPINWNVTDEMCQYIANEFNNVIYPTDVNYFGIPNDRDGTNNYFQYVYAAYPPERYYWIPTDNPQRVIIKIFNILDQSYYDPTYPSYVVGFFNSAYDSPDYYDRNMIHIDNYAYWQRLGSLGHIWYPDRPDKIVTRPYVYESTIAHEFQHLIHNDYNPQDPSFMNEGCAMYAELLCNYGISPSYFNYYFYSPDNSLTEWGDQGDYNILADYGVAALWAVYLSDHYGGANFIRYFVQNGIPGIDGVNAALKKFKYAQRFDDVYHDWRIANLIRSDTPGNGKYNYKSLDLNAPGIIPIRQYSEVGAPVPWTKGTDFGTTWTIAGYDTGVSLLGSYGSDYIEFTRWPKTEWVTFKGDNTLTITDYGPQWTLVDGVWWSDNKDLQNNVLASGQIYVDPLGDTTLTLVTKYNLEWYWDFGFVQVSTDLGHTWASLSNGYTTSDHDPSAHPNVMANLPGLTGNVEGLSDNTLWDPASPMTTMTFDLKAYKGKTVMIGFRHVTDWATTYDGWFIQSANVSGNPLTLSVFYDFPPAPRAFQVDLITVLTGKTNEYEVKTMIINPLTLTGQMQANARGRYSVIMIVSPLYQYDAHPAMADYQFTVTATT